MGWCGEQLEKAFCLDRNYLLDVDNYFSVRPSALPTTTTTRSFEHTKIIAMPWHGQLYVAGKIDGKWILAIGGRLVELCNRNRSSSLFKFACIIVS